MSDDARESQVPKCPDCGKPVTFGEEETTAFGAGGRERQRGAAICMNKKCPMYKRSVNLG